MIPQPHCIDLYRPTFVQGTAQEISGYNLVAENIPAFIQPMDSKESFYYEQRGLEDLHSVYTTDVCTVFQRNDILEWQGNQYHVVGIKNGLNLNIYQDLSCEQFPEGAKKRLDREAYE